MAARCAGCDEPVSLTAAPRVTGAGRVELWCGPCARGERPPVVAAVEPIEPPPRPRRSMRRAIAGALGAVTAATVALVASGNATHPARPAAAGIAPTIAVADDVLDEVEVIDAADDTDDFGAHVDDGPLDHHAAVEPGAPRRPIPEIPTRDGEPLDEWMPTLRDWVHPVPGTAELIPSRSTRFFGAERDGVDRPECGGGHCGVDLHGDVGQAVVAVAWGTVSKIQRDPNRRGGRYVRIEHPDFVYSSYFHLDRIAEDLVIGEEVEPGRALGSLGSSGINVSTPHLHFSLELPTAGGATIYVDPSPYLARASVFTRTADLDAVVAPPADP
jgi:murein DD-endopeptidase MepM/ murein hydrolase activator NlpD